MLMKPERRREIQARGRELSEEQVNRYYRLCIKTFSTAMLKGHNASEVKRLSEALLERYRSKP